MEITLEGLAVIGIFIMIQIWNLTDVIKDGIRTLKGIGRKIHGIE